MTFQLVPGTASAYGLYVKSQWGGLWRVELDRKVSWDGNQEICLFEVFDSSSSRLPLLSDIKHD